MNGMNMNGMNMNGMNMNEMNNMGVEMDTSNNKTNNKDKPISKLESKKVIFKNGKKIIVTTTTLLYSNGIIDSFNTYSNK